MERKEGKAREEGKKKKTHCTSAYIALLELPKPISL
jgi:hypothetical protein